MKSIQTIFRLFLLLFLLLTPARSTSASLEPPQATLSLLKDIVFANQSSEPFFQVGLADRFLFTTLDEQVKSRLWSSAGSYAGTELLHEGSVGSFFRFGERAVFLQYPAPGSAWLTVTDGTLAGTEPVIEFTGSYPAIASAAQVGDWLYFLLSRDTGHELWRTNGTAGQTAQLAQGLSFYEHTEVEPEVAVLGDSLYFNASDGSSGYELWRIPSAASEAAGAPQLVKDICQGSCGRPNPGDASPHFFTALGSRLYFAANDAVHGQELWSTDGTAAGTALVRDIRPGVDGSVPKELTVAGSRLFFTASDGALGVEVWQSSGTVGTTGVVDLLPGAVSSDPHGLAALGANLFLAAKGDSYGVELWRVDGATLAAQRVDIAPGRNSSAPAALTALQGRLFFSAQSLHGDRELWQWDEGARAASRVKDIVPGADGSSPRGLHAWNDLLVFSAADPLHNRELWTSDGSAAGTNMLYDFNPAPDTRGSTPADFRSFGSLTLFTAYDPLHGTELWSTRGTPQTTWLVRDFIPGPSDGFLNTADMAALGGVVYFTASDTTSYDPPRPEELREYGAELWRTDGTPQGTWMVRDIRPGLAGSSPSHFIVMGEKVYFFANDGEHGALLWKTDGTPAGTAPVSTQYPVDALQVQAAALDDVLIYGCSNSFGQGTYSLYRSDGTATGTIPYLTTGSQMYNYSPRFTLAFEGNVYQGFQSKINPFDLFWMTDGTANGTVAVYFPGAEVVRAPEILVPLGNALYFVAQTRRGAFDGYSLWKLPAGTNSAEWIVDLSGVTQAKAPVKLGAFQFAFLIEDGQGATWWRSDGTAVGTGELCPSCNFPSIGEYTTWRGHLFFTNDNGGGAQVWISDGSEAGTRLLSEVEPGLALTDPLHLYGGDYGLYLAANYAHSGPEPWIYRLDLPWGAYLPVASR